MADRAVDEDLDDPAEHCATGPGRPGRRRTPDPVIEVYADGAIDRPCPEPGCGAQPLDFCRDPATGVYRKLPHTRR